MPRNRWGFEVEDWETTKKKVKQLLIGRARRRTPISYGALVHEIGPLPFNPNDPRLDDLLGEVSTEENAEGRGMLTVLVIHQLGDRLPGPGFFRLARELGYRFDNERIFWGEEFDRVCNVWEAMKLLKSRS
jgi:hypothetical protein